MPAQNIWRYLSSLSASEVFSRTNSFLLMMPSRHLSPASNTPDPELPVVATSRITVGNFVRTSKGSNLGRQNARARRTFGNCDDNRLAGPRKFFTERHAAHLHLNGQFCLFNE